jgi:hypothetical protein
VHLIDNFIQEPSSRTSLVQIVLHVAVGHSNKVEIYFPHELSYSIPSSLGISCCQPFICICKQATCSSHAENTIKINNRFALPGGRNLLTSSTVTLSANPIQFCFVVHCGA